MWKTKRILITGVASGIGAEVALPVSEQRANVMIAIFRRKNALKFFRKAKNQGLMNTLLKGMWPAIQSEQLPSNAKTLLVVLDVVINNAGMTTRQRLCTNYSDDILIAYCG